MEVYSMLRIRCDAPQWGRFKVFLSCYGDVIAECYETPQGENPHYHAAYRLAGSSIDALKRARSRRFKNQEDMKGNKVASITEMDKQEEFFEYLCKGQYAFKDDYKMYKGKSEPKVEVYLTEIFNKSIQEYHDNFWKRHEKDVPKKSKNFTKDIVLEFEDKYISNDIQYDELEDKEVMVPKLICPTILLEYVMSKFSLEFKPMKMSLVIDICRLIWYRNKTHFTGYYNSQAYEQFVEKATMRIFESRPF